MRRVKDFLLLISSAVVILLFQSNSIIFSTKNNSFEFSIYEYLNKDELCKYRYAIFINSKPKIKFSYEDTSSVYIVDYNDDESINNVLNYYNNTIVNHSLYLIIKVDRYYYLCTYDKPKSFFSSFSKKRTEELYPLLISESNNINLYQFNCSEIDNVIYFTIPYEGDMKFENSIDILGLFDLKTNGSLAKVIEKLILFESVQLGLFSKGFLNEKEKIEHIKQETIIDINKLIKFYALRINNKVGSDK